MIRIIAAFSPRWWIILGAWLLCLYSFSQVAITKLSFISGSGQMHGYEAFLSTLLHLLYPLNWSLFVSKPAAITIFPALLGCLFMLVAPWFNSRVVLSLPGYVLLAVAACIHFLLRPMLIGQVHQGYWLWLGSMVLMAIGFLFPADWGIGLSRRRRLRQAVEKQAG